MVCFLLHVVLGISFADLRLRFVRRAAVCRLESRETQVTCEHSCSDMKQSRSLLRNTDMPKVPDDTCSFCDV